MSESVKRWKITLDLEMGVEDDSDGSNYDLTPTAKLPSALAVVVGQVKDETLKSLFQNWGFEDTATVTVTVYDQHDPGSPGKSALLHWDGTRWMDG